MDIPEPKIGDLLEYPGGTRHIIIDVQRLGPGKHPFDPASFSGRHVELPEGGWRVWVHGGAEKLSFVAYDDVKAALHKNPKWGWPPQNARLLRPVCETIYEPEKPDV
jgi:hypothetical protein